MCHFHPMRRDNLAVLSIGLPLQKRLHNPLVQLALKLYTTSVFLGKTGTVISRLPPKAYAALRSAFKAKMSLHKNTSAVSVLDMCFDLTGFKTVTIPTVSFYFSGGAVLELSIPTSKLKADVPYNHSDNEEMMHPAFTMKSVGVLVLLTVLSSAHVTKLQIGIKFKPLKCDFQTHKEDKIKVHYRKHHLHVLNLPCRRPKAQRGLTLKETQQMEFFSQYIEDESLLQFVEITLRWKHLAPIAPSTITKNLIIALFWFLSSDSTIDAFNSFVCETGAGNHILGALFVDLEPLLLMKSVPKHTGNFYILSSLSPGTTSSMVRKQFPSLFILTDSSNELADNCSRLQGLLVFNAVGGVSGSCLGSLLFEHLSVNYTPYNSVLLPHFLL
ncbi:hypothetical protein HID58_085402 [Brassica napus]|uniref:Xylanase inhibitor C-terminal domain-containing protein n=1 Tax=Brassica napus TaxID=3708 RepID=A0ABQ7XQ12_BRANA|nr:hypothetical protein HID58_085402 [Brassica napus]